MKPKDQKQREALERNGVWQSMTPKQQLEDLDRRGHVAKKQRAKIQAKIEKSA